MTFRGGILMGALALAIGCTDPEKQVQVIAAPAPSFSPAPPSACPYGGTQIRYQDETYNICNGAPGARGPAGTPGQDASPVTVVQLCSGTTTYPTQFVEIAFCIADNLYATYSANGGFSTLIPPGVYTSAGIGSSCTFTVQPHCVVHQ